MCLTGGIRGRKGKPAPIRKRDGRAGGAEADRPDHVEHRRPPAGSVHPLGLPPRGLDIVVSFRFAPVREVALRPLPRAGPDKRLGQTLADRRSRIVAGVCHDVGLPTPARYLPQVRRGPVAVWPLHARCVRVSRVAAWPLSPGRSRPDLIRIPRSATGPSSLYSCSAARWSKFSIELSASPSFSSGSWSGSMARQGFAPDPVAAVPTTDDRLSESLRPRRCRFWNPARPADLPDPDIVGLRRLQT